MTKPYALALGHIRDALHDLEQVLDGTEGQTAQQVGMACLMDVHEAMSDIIVDPTNHETQVKLVECADRAREVVRCLDLSA
jgi:hypothetical protein